jgi:formylmethanofuran dehydrogenase subunit B
VQGVLSRKEADACLLVGSETLSWLLQASLDHLVRIPTVMLDTAGRETILSPTVRFRTATGGIDLAGTAYRMDGVPVGLRAVLPARFPSDAVILEAIERKL